MKRIFILLAILPLISHAQPADPKEPIPEKGDNLITITTQDGPKANFDVFGRYLVSKGYTFSSKDPDFLSLVTDQKEPDHGYWYTLSITFQDNDIIIRAKQSGLAMGSTITNPILIWTEWKYAQSGGNYNKKSFDDFYPILKDFGYAVFFSKE